MSVDGPASDIYVVIDLETTGIVTDRDRVYEVGVVIFNRDGNVVERFDTLVRPDGRLSKRLGAALTDAPAFSEVAGLVVDRLRRGTVVGHSARFDLEMLDAELVRLGLGLPEIPFLCTDSLALALHVDSPSRRLGMLCRVLGVEMENWHTAVADAEATGHLLFKLLTIADDRSLGELVRKPQRFAGSAVEWPSLMVRGPTLPRDPSAFPPIGEQPDALDPLSEPGAGREVAVMIEIPKDLLEKLRAATHALDERMGPQDPDYVAALDDWGSGGFRGREGVERLSRITRIFTDQGDEDAWESALQLARLMRYEPGYGGEDVRRAYVRAMELAVQCVQDADERHEATEEVCADWADFLTFRQDIDGLEEMIDLVGANPELVPSKAVVSLVHRMRTAGQTEAAVGACAVLAQALGSKGAAEAAADVSAEWAQVLSETGKPDGALEVCTRAWASGWASRNLANRHSLLLEHTHAWAEAAEICERGLALAPRDEQIAKRRGRCLRKLE